MLNSTACDLLEEGLKTYYSDDCAVTDTHDNSYSKEILKAVSISGLSPRQLTPKLRMQVILLRIFNPLNGLYNGSL